MKRNKERGKKWGGWIADISKLPNKEKEIIIYSTRTPDLNMVLTEMGSLLVNKLMDCAKAVADGDLKHADFLFEEMEVLTAEETSEVTKKVVSCFAEALARRVHGIYPRNPVPLPSSIRKYQGEFFRSVTPLSTFFVHAGAFPGACVGTKLVHFIDFSFMLDSWGGECFLTQCAPRSVFRLTSIGPNLCKDNYHLQEMQRKLAEMARKLNIFFQHKQFEANVPADIEECVLKLSRTTEDEMVIVKWEFVLHKLLAVEGAIERVLSKLKELKPNLMLIMEQEANHNIPDFFERFTLSFRHYSRVFNYLDSFLSNSYENMIVEKQWRRQIINIVTCEGIDRVERHQTFAQWKERLLGAGFLPAKWASNVPWFKVNPQLPFVYPIFYVSLWEPIDPAQFSCVTQGVDINCPITIQDASVSSVIEPEEVCSSESDDDNTFESDKRRILRIEKKWSAEEVREYLFSSLTGRESKRINRWMTRQLTGNFSGRDRKLNVRDASLASLLRIPPPNVPIGKDKEYYVDDPVINAFFELLKKRWEKFPNLYMKNYSLPTWIVSFLLSGKWTETEVLSYLNIEEIAGTSKLFVPVCLENHWILICVHIERKALMWLDSLNLTSEAHRAQKGVISKWIIEHLMPKLGYDNAQEWRVFEPVDIPYQTNRVDCGIFVMKYADCLALGDHFPFTQQDIPHFRHQIFLDIYRGGLRPQICSKNCGTRYYV